MPVTETRAILAYNIRALRCLVGKSQGITAEVLGVKRNRYNHWETGFASPSLENLVEISRLYGVTVDALLKTRITDKKKITLKLHHHGEQITYLRGAPSGGRGAGTLL